MRRRRQFSAGEDHPKRYGPDRGFTLIELAVVIAVVGILTVVTMPKYESVVNHYRLESSAQSVLATLRHAQQMAIEQRQTFYIYVGFTDDAMQILTYPKSPGTFPDPQNLTPAESPVRFESGVKFISPPKGPPVSSGLLTDLKDTNSVSYPGGLEYDWQGFVSGASVNPVVVLQASNGMYVSIEIEALTGVLTVKWP